MSLELSDPVEGYVYGKKIFIDTDHKPLESIIKKSLLSAPKRLQRMLYVASTVHKFDFLTFFDVYNRKGTEMHLTDPLS